MSITVTATQGGAGAHSGTFLQVMVLTSAAVTQNGGTGSVSSGSAGPVTVITTQTGSRVYGAAIRASTTAPTVEGNTTQLGLLSDTNNGLWYGAWEATSLTGTPGSTVLGYSTTFTGGCVGAEILTAGTLTEDGSAPAAVSTMSATTITTASFTPPAGSLLVAMVGTGGTASQVTMALSDTSNLTWVEVINANAAGNGYAGVWIAQVPNVSVSGPGHASFSPSYLVRYRHGHFGPTPRQSASMGVSVNNYLATLTALSVTTGSVQSQISKTITAASVIIGAVGNLITRTLIALAVIYGAVKRNITRSLLSNVVMTASTQRTVGRILSGIVTVTGSTGRNISRMVTAQVVLTGSMVRKVLPNIVAVVILGSVITRGVSRAIQGNFIVAGQTVRQTGRGIASVIVATMQNTKLSNKLLTSTAVVTVSVSRNMGKIVNGVVVVAGQFSTLTRRFLTFAAQTVVTASTVAGRTFFMTLAVVSSVVATVFRGGQHFIVRFGIATTKWLAGSIGGRWRTPGG
jgi:hypothetical protein